MRLDRTFQFRGNRDYLHSAAVLDDLLRIRHADTTNIDLKFHRRTVQQVSYTDEPQAAPDSVAEWSDSSGKLWLVERAEYITERVPYDEPALVRMFEVDGRTVKSPPRTPGFTPADAMVAAFKHLLQTVHAGIERKYVFVRIRLDHCPGTAFEIRYVRDIGAFFQGDIGEDGKVIGQVFFGVW
ncbi:MAG: hypothetical protein ACREPP_08725 [Rhodanobacteraceae bacterium]